MTLSADRAGTFEGHSTPERVAVLAMSPFLVAAILLRVWHSLNTPPLPIGDLHEVPVARPRLRIEFSADPQSAYRWTSATAHRFFVEAA